MIDKITLPGENYNVPDYDEKLANKTNEIVATIKDLPKVTIATTTTTTDASGFVRVGTYPNRDVNVFGFIQSFDGKTNLDLRYYYLIPVRNGDAVFFKVEATNGADVIRKPITFVYTVITPL